MENHAAFLDRFKLKMTERDLLRLDLAYDMAKYGHRNQKRESGERYFEHVRSVATILSDELGITNVEILISALLHDILEDSYIVKGKRINLIFGGKVARITKVLTKPKKDKVAYASKQERVSEYFRKITEGGFEAKVIKLADRLHNLRTLGACSPEKKKKKIEETRIYVLPIIESLKTEYPAVAQFFEDKIGAFIAS